jgi:hypothetical protein
MPEIMSYIKSHVPEIMSYIRMSLISDNAPYYFIFRVGILEVIVLL